MYLYSGFSRVRSSLQPSTSVYHLMLLSRSPTRSMTWGGDEGLVLRLVNVRDDTLQVMPLAGAVQAAHGQHMTWEGMMRLVMLPELNPMPLNTAVLPLQQHDYFSMEIPNQNIREGQLGTA